MKYVNRDFYSRPMTNPAGRQRVRRTRARARRRGLVGSTAFGVLLVCVTIVCAAQGLVHLQGFASLSGEGARYYEEVVVRPGDTLWAIAVEYGDSSKDPRAIVDELRQINGLYSASLRVGDVLQVPTNARTAGVR